MVFSSSSTGVNVFVEFVGVPGVLLGLTLQMLFHNSVAL